MPRPRTDIAPRIVHAARDLFVAAGVDGTSLRQIARAARTSIGMIYYYFPTKDELFLAVVEEVYAHILAELELALRPDDEVRERLRRVYRRIGAVTELELQVIRLIAREMLISSERRARLVDRFQRGHLPMMLATLAAGIADGSIADLPPSLALIVTLAVGAAPQFARRALADRPPFCALPTGDALADRLIDVLFAGIGGPAAAKRGA
jgi:AcrR family transcriptional regulator